MPGANYNPMTLIALIPVQDNEHVLQKNVLGIQPLRAPGFPLGELANILFTGVGADGNATIVNAGETAIPDVCAHVQYLRSSLKSGLDMGDEAVRAWVGVMAMIAISELRERFKLSVQTINLSGAGYMRTVYRQALQNEQLLDQNGCLRVLTFNGNPVAVLEPEGMVGPDRCFCYPFSTIDNPQGCMTSAPWFRPGGEDARSGKRIAHRWADVTGNDPDTKCPFLNDAEKAAFVVWLDALRKSGRIDPAAPIQQAVTGVIRRLNTDLADDSGALINLETTFNNPATHRPQNLTDWRGVLACIGLGKMQGFDIDVERYRANPAGDPLREILLQGAPEWMVLKINGARVGYLDPNPPASNVLVRPFYYVTDELRHVPWFRNGRWVEISGNDVPTQEMDQTERRKLAFWYNQVAPQCQCTSTVVGLQSSADELVRSFGTALGGQMAPIPALTVTSTPDGIPIAQQFTNIMGLMNSVPDFTYPMPPISEIFTDVLALTMASTDTSSKLGILDGTNIVNSVKVTDDSEPSNVKTDRFLALLPLRSSFTSMFVDAPDGGFHLSGVELEQDGLSIVVTITLSNAQVPVVKRKTYSALKGEICTFNQFPYLAMWPYVRSDTWKEYHVVWCQGLESNTPSSVFVPTDKVPQPVQPYVESSTLAGDNGSDGSSWWTLIYHSFPEYVHLQIVDGGVPLEIGSIYVRPPEEHITAGGVLCYAAIDFGSSNTIVRLTDARGSTILDGPNQPYRVFTNDFVKPLTMCANELETYYGRIKDFHEFFWLPFTGMGDSGAQFWVPNPEVRTDHLPTVVELYQGASQVNNQAPRFGQFLRSNCNVMAYFLNRQTLTKKSIEQLGIRSNIKMRKDGDQYVGQIAIQMILLECALAATVHNARLSYVVSYPDQKMWDNLKPLWTIAASNAVQICGGINNAGVKTLKVTELLASKFYATKFVGMANAQAGYCILDIGGGTSDISLWRDFGYGEQMTGGLSLKYAGNQITSESIFSFYRAVRNAQNPNINNFRSLWNLKDAPTAIKVYEQRMEKGFDLLMDLNLNVNANQDAVHNQVPILATTLVSDYKFSNDVQLNNPSVSPFVALLRFKVSSVFYIVARYIQLTGGCNQDNPLVPYYVCMAGNGAAALDACGDEMPGYLTWLMQAVLGERRFEIQNLPNYRKTEVVNGMCAMLAPADGGGGVDFNVIPENMQSLFGNTEQSYDDQWLTYWMFNYYCYYIEYIVKAQQDFFYLDTLFSGDGINNTGIDTIYDMLTMCAEGVSWSHWPWEEGEPLAYNEKNRGLFMANQHKILQQVKNEVEVGTPPSLIADIAAIKMADYLLLVHKFQ